MPQFPSAVKGLQWAACGVGSALRRRTFESALRRRTFDLTHAQRWTVLPGETGSLNSVQSELKHPSGGAYLLSNTLLLCTYHEDSLLHHSL